MLNHWTIVPIFVLLFLGLNLAIGLLAARGHVKSTADHVVGGRNLGFLLVFFMSIGEIYSSVAFLGQPGWAYEHGVQILANVGIFIGMMAFWLGPKVWKSGREHGYLTQAQLFGDRFQSPGLRAIASVTGIVAMIPYIAIQMIGAGYVFNITTGGRIPFWVGALLAFSVVGLYVYAGGLRAISWVAVLKGFFMAGVGTYVVYRVVGQFYGDVPHMFHEIAVRSPQNLTLPGPKNFATFTFHTTSLLNSLVAFYMWPHMFANFYGAREPRVIQRQAMLIPLYNIITLSFTLVGFAGILALQGIRPDTVMVEMLLRVAPLWLVGLFCAGALSASMVTGGACALAAAATIGNDLLQPRLDWPDRRLKKAIQLLVFLVVGVAYVIALMQPALIVYIILMAYSFTAQLFPAAMVAFYTKIQSGTPVLCGLLAGFATALLFVLHIVTPPYNIHPGILGLAVNVTVLLIVSRLVARESIASAAPQVRRSKEGAVATRLLCAAGVALLALANWPLLTVFNRIEPFVLGLPFFVFAMLAINLLVGVFLFAAYQVTGRFASRDESSTAGFRMKS
jgi:SSS family solute:Na+ symporter